MPAKKPKASVACAYCGKVFCVCPSDAERRKFCSRSCAARSRTGKHNSNWKGGLVIVQCEVCGKEFELKRKDTRGSLGRFCSQKCHGVWRSRALVGKNACHWQGGPVTIVCEQCQTPFEVKRFRKNTARFCSNECHAAWTAEHYSGENSPTWKGGYGRYYGPGWHRKRDRARARDGYTCQRCGITEDGQEVAHSVHHIIPFRAFDYIPGKNSDYRRANRLANLVTLCASCHHIVEVNGIDFELKHAPPAEFVEQLHFEAMLCPA